MQKKKLWLPSIFSDNMMLQAGKENLLWGSTTPGSSVSVVLAKKKVTGRADKKGLFKIKLPAVSHGGPYTMTVQAAGKKRVINNVLIGDVWICSGQSNMAMVVKNINNGLTEIKQAKYPKMRIFTVPQIYSLKPFTDVNGKWKEVAPSNIAEFSAAGYFFGRELHKRLKIPVGLIDTSFGGTSIEWWMSEEAIQSWQGFPELKKHTLSLLKKAKKAKLSNKKIQQLGNELHKDTGNEGINLGYEKGDYDFKDWKGIKAPGYWNAQGLDLVGAVWFKKEITIPEKWTQYDLVLELGPIVDFDSTYFNGEKVGGVGSDFPNFWAYNRRYLVPARLLKAGENNITVRVFAANRVGGFGAAKGTMLLSVVNHPDLGKVKLDGKWKYKIERALPSFGMGSTGEGIDERTYGTLYNTMVSPLVGFGIKGFIWYQGENNAAKPKDYSILHKLFINDLRDKWQDKELPFYFVQLANYVTENDWAAFREAQRDALKLKNTGMAVAIDIGEGSDIHPKNKQDVGKRLALNALAKTYGKKVEYSGPVYRFMEIKGKKVRIVFDHAESGLKTKDNKFLAGFEIAGKSGNFVNAKAKIDKKSVLVWNDSIEKPLAVRYAWANNPVCNLYNKEGLPAVPFSKRSKDSK